MDGWIEARELPGRLDELVDGACAMAGIDHPALGAEWVVEHCAWYAASLLAEALMDGRVPDLAPDRVLLEIRDGAVWGIALADDGAEPAAPGGPREAHGAAAAAPGGPREAHDALAAFLDPLVDAVRLRRLRARKSLWLAVGDRVAQAFLSYGAAHGDLERARRLAQAMLAPPSPMHVPLRTATGEDGTPFHVRASCCLYHRVPGAEVCPGCPLRSSPRLRAAAGSA